MGKGPCPLAGVAENLWLLLVVCTGKGPSSGRGLVGVVASASSGDAFCGGAAFNKVLLPLWLFVVFTAYMFGPASLGLCVGSLDS